MKRCLLFLIAIAILISPPDIFAQDNTAEISVEQRIVEMLTYVQPLGKSEVTRAAFCRMLCEITDPEEPTASVVVFDDVDISSDGAGYIQKLYESGVISGNGNRLFYPGDRIKLVDCYTILLKMLGYNEFIKDGYPEKIATLAAESGLAKNIGLSADEYIDTETAYRLVYNFLYSDIMEYTLSSSGGYRKGGKYIEEILKIYSDNGLVEAAEGYSLYGKEYKEDTVEIDGELFVGNGKIKADSIGLYGKYWYRENDDGDSEICGFLPLKNKTLKIMAEDIKSYADNTYTYYDDNKTKTAKLSRGKDIVYNREQKTDESSMKPAYGYCLLIDNDSDGSYDVVMIFEYRNIFAVYSSAARESISYNTLENGTAVKKEFLFGDKEYKIYNSKGKEIALSEIVPNSVLTVMESENKIEVYQSQKTVTGKITRVKEDSVSVDGEEYELASEVFRDGWNGSELINAVLYLDRFGKVAAVKKSGDSRWQFGYLIKYGYDSREEEMRFKLLNEEGTVVTYNSVANKLKIDGVSTEVSENAADNITRERVIRFKTNTDGKINAIDTAKDLSSFDVRSTEGTGEDCLLRRADGKLLYKSSIKYFKKESQAAAMELNGEAFVDKNTVMFNVPAAVDSSTEDSDYYLVKSLGENTKERIASYNTSPSKIASDVIVVYNSQVGKTTKSSRTMLVRSTGSALRNEETVSVLYGLYDGKESVLTVSDSLSDTAEKLKEGDFIRIGMQGDVVRDIELLYSSDGKGELNKNYYFGTGANYGTVWRYLIGKVSAQEDEKIMFTYNDGASDINEFIRINGFNAYVYDPNLQGDARVHMGTVGEITDMRSDSVNCDTVIVGSREHENHDMLIIKKKLQ